MKIYDKVQWHTDAGESANEVITKMKMVFSFFTLELHRIIRGKEPGNGMEVN